MTIPALEPAGHFYMKHAGSKILLALLVPALAWAAPNPRLVLPDFAALAQKASQAVTITLDPALISLAARFLDGNDPQDAATREIIKGLQGIYVRSYTFDKDSAYQQADIDAEIGRASCRER